MRDHRTWTIAAHKIILSLEFSCNCEEQRSRGRNKTKDGGRCGVFSVLCLWSFALCATAVATLWAEAQARHLSIAIVLTHHDCHPQAGTKKNTHTVPYDVVFSVFVQSWYPFLLGF